MALLWRSYWCFSLIHLSLTYHTAMEDWVKLPATTRTFSLHTRALPEQRAAREVRRQNPTCLRLLTYPRTEILQTSPLFSAAQWSQIKNSGPSWMTAAHEDYATNVRERQFAQSVNTVAAPSCPGSQGRHTAVPHSYFLDTIFKNLSILLLNFCTQWRKTSMRSRNQVLQVKHLH